VNQTPLLATFRGERHAEGAFLAQKMPTGAVIRPFAGEG
jgi:hypothetical protein